MEANNRKISFTETDKKVDFQIIKAEPIGESVSCNIHDIVRVCIYFADREDTDKLILKVNELISDIDGQRIHNNLNKYNCVTADIYRDSVGILSRISGIRAIEIMDKLDPTD